MNLLSRLLVCPLSSVIDGNFEWYFAQEWKDVLFMHWKVNPQLLAPKIPMELELDLFNGEAWISVVAFRMKNARIRRFPSFPPISNFDEINLRTYVKHQGSPGVYFIDIKSSKLLSTWVSKAFSGLDYQFEPFQYQENGIYLEGKDELFTQFKVDPNVLERNRLNDWLVERYRYFNVEQDKPVSVEIKHAPWVLKDVQLRNLNLSYPNYQELFGEMPQLVQFSEGVKVWAGAKCIVKDELFTKTMAS